MVLNKTTIKANDSSVAAHDIKDSEIHINNGISIDDHERIIRARETDSRGELDQVKGDEAEHPSKPKEGSSAAIKAAYIAAAGAVIVALITTFGSGGSGSSINQTVGDGGTGVVNTGNGNVLNENPNQK